MKTRDASDAEEREKANMNEISMWSKEKNFSLATHCECVCNTINFILNQQQKQNQSKIFQTNQYFSNLATKLMEKKKMLKSVFRQ